ncbi:MAG: hypothetical protein ISS44_02580 [Candidatus Omnitrophica bacterium]|nr:hypothetical protein [Candidatus Omnitrophota bacterium]
MKLNKFFFIVVLLALGALLCVHQRTKVYRFAYQVENNLTTLENLLNENNLLRYDLNKKSSVVSLAHLFQERRLQWPGKDQLVIAYSSRDTESAPAVISKSKNLFVRIFDLKTQAQAQTTCASK